MNEENLRKKIRSLLDELQNEADPDMLNRYRSIFRQEVSFFRRSYFAAHLLFKAEGPIEAKPAAHSFRPPSGSRNKRETKRSRGGNLKLSRTDSQFEDSQQVLSEEESAQLFVSIGRNRKVFPRDFISLITAKAGISRHDIGAIRILDNYSFIQIRSLAADSVINALNGQGFRGRTLTVNYARSRREDEEEQEGAANGMHKTNE